MAEQASPPTDAAAPPPPPRPFDVAYFLRGFPQKLGLFDVAMFACSAAESDVPTIVQSTDGCMGGEFFAGAKRLGCVGFRLEADSLAEALGFTRHLADALVDSFSVALSRPLPRLSLLALVCDSTEPEGKWVHFSPVAWMEMSTEKPAPGGGLSERAKTLLTRMSPLLTLAAKAHPRHDTPLARQLIQSLRTYRHGATADSFGVEFLCKFTALESLVCTQSGGKRENLSTLLPLLFRGDPRVTVDRINRIWADRNAAVHESAGFYSKHTEGSRAVQVHLQEIDYLFRGVVDFTLAHLDSASTVKELWQRAGRYQLPAWAIDRSTKVIRLEAHETFHETGVTVPWAKRWFQVYHEHAQRQRNEPSE